MARSGKDATPAPKKRRFAQIRDVFGATRKADPSVVWWMLLGALGTILVMVVIGLLLKAWVYFLILSLPMAFLVALVILMRRAERAAYRSIEGRPGAAGAALSGLRRGWYYDQSPVAAEATKPGDMNATAMVFRAVGRPGVVLVAEGPKARATKLVESERKKVNRVAPGVNVTVLRMGDGEGEVPIRKLSRTITRMKPVLTKQEVSAVNKRLKALGSLKPPVPAGMDPFKARVDRKAMRGR